jgi:SAM-dependent methyltransferase
VVRHALQIRVVVSHLFSPPSVRGFLLRLRRSIIYSNARAEDNMNAIVNKIKRALAVYGFMGVIILFFKTTVRYIFSSLPSHKKNIEAAQRNDLEFDRKWGVDTCGIVTPSSSEVVGSNWLVGIKYQGCNSVALDDILNSLPIQHRDFSFVDFGSGKGRAILVASRYPFKKILGVEYSEKLNKIARHNVSIFPDSEKRCFEIEIVCADAAAFKIPNEPVLIFLFNPFGRQVMATLESNIFASFRQNKRRIIVVYFNPIFRDVWKRVGFLAEVRRSQGCMIYDTQGDETTLPIA